MIITAVVYIPTKEQGGKGTTLFDESSVNLFFNSPENNTDGYILTEANPGFFPGNKYTLEFSLRSPEDVQDFLYKGSSFKGREGATGRKMVLEGTITSISEE